MGGGLGNVKTQGAPPTGALASARPPPLSGSRSPSLTRPKAAPAAKAARSQIDTLERSASPARFWRPRKEPVVLDKRAFVDEEGDDNSIDRLSRQSAERLRQAILEIDEEGAAAHRWLPIGEWRTGAFAVGFITLSALAMDPWAQALAEEGQEAAASGDVVSEVTSLVSNQGLILFTPILLYLVYTVYRTALNPRAKLLDFLFLIASFFIVFNIISILFFKTRYF